MCIRKVLYKEYSTEENVWLKEQRENFFKLIKQIEIRTRVNNNKIKHKSKNFSFHQLENTILENDEKTN